MKFGAVLGQGVGLQGQWDHLRLFGADYKDKLAEVGFKVEIIEPNKDYFRYGVNQEEKLYIGKK